MVRRKGPKVLGVILTVKIDEDLVRRLDEAAFKESKPGKLVSRSDLVRALLGEALDARDKRKR